MATYSCTSAVSQSSNGSDSNTCPSEPRVALSQNNIEEISLEKSALTKSGNVGVSQAKGYIFEGKSGDKLSYQTDNNVCIWIYTPDNNLLTDNNLELNGKYTLQVEALRGSTSFELEMGLGELSENVALVDNSNKPDDSSNTPPNDSEEISSDDENIQASASVDSLSEDQAKSLVQEWLDAKSRIFSPPFDRNLVRELTAGILYEDITKTGGSIDWLRNNNSYYIYNESRVEDVYSFSSDSERPSIKVSIFEDRVLIGKTGNPDASQSGSSTENFTYFFVRDNGVWKIEDYKSDS